MFVASRRAKDYRLVFRLVCVHRPLDEAHERGSTFLARQKTWMLYNDSKCGHNMIIHI